MFDRDKYLEEIDANGYAIIEDVFSPEFIQKAKRELESAIEKEVLYHKGKRDYVDYGMVLMCSMYGGAFIELFDNPKLIDPVNAVLGESCIVYAYTSSSMPPNKSNYSKRIHVDSPRLIPGYITTFGVFIALDDMTEENGTMWFLPGSHLTIDTPSEEYFTSHAKRLICKAGSVMFLNPRMWHRGGDNNTDKWRHATTISFVRPYMKQRIDIPRAMSEIDISSYSETAKQKLGFYAQVPANYDEYYLPKELRKFKQSAE